jgi:hypothetical protein
MRGDKVGVGDIDEVQGDLIIKNKLYAQTALSLSQSLPSSHSSATEWESKTSASQDFYLIKRRLCTEASTSFVARGMKHAHVGV